LANIFLGLKVERRAGVFILDTSPLEISYD
jgi:hypothetical protein